MSQGFGCDGLEVGTREMKGGCYKRQTRRRKNPRESKVFSKGSVVILDCGAHEAVNPGDSLCSRRDRGRNGREGTAVCLKGNCSSIPGKKNNRMIRLEDNHGEEAASKDASLVHSQGRCGKGEGCQEL